MRPMRLSIGIALTLVPASALAEDGGATSSTPPLTSSRDQAVIGGSAAPAGKWPDAAAVLWGGQQGCSGTLIAPNVVVTAGHCVLADDPPDQVLVGASALSKAAEGQTSSILEAIEYENSQSTIDVGLLVLAQPVTGIEPRAIATGWAKLDIQNGAAVQLVGFGTVDRDAHQPTDSLMEAATTITDFNCTVMAGCAPAARPDGELGAGGMGIDTCPGDSGGPVYLLTDYGSFLTGITSRGYETNQYNCSEGGIYERPDKVIDWMEQAAGVTLARGPTPAVLPIAVVRGGGGETVIEPNDPKSTEHGYAVTRQPGHGMAAVRDDGTVRVCADPAYTGEDTAEVMVTDKANPARALPVVVPITIDDGDPPDECDVNDFSGDGGGCCDTGRSSGGSIPLAMAVLLVLRRRRK